MKNQYTMAIAKISLVSLSCLCFQGCAIVADALKSSVEAYAAESRLISQSEHEASSTDVRSGYFTVELMTSTPSKWKIKVLATEPLVNAELAQVLLQYRLDEEDFEMSVPLTLNDYEKDSADSPLHTYLYGIDDIKAEEFYGEFKKKLFDFEKPRFNYQLQPIFPSYSGNHSKVDSIEYMLAEAHGYLDVGGLLRLNMFVDDDAWQSFCDDKQVQYIYNKTSACGNATVTDLPCEE